MASQSGAWKFQEEAAEAYVAERAGFEGGVGERQQESGWYSLQTLYTACFIKGRV